MESQNHWFTYDEKMQVKLYTVLRKRDVTECVKSPLTTNSKCQVESVAQAVSNLAIQFGDSDDDAGVMSRY